MRDLARNPDMPNKAGVFSLDKKLNEKKLCRPQKKTFFLIKIFM